jgi:hypothetical protein
LSSGTNGSAEIVSEGARRMAEERIERRLAAILAADVVGYSRLVGIDEEAPSSTPSPLVPRNSQRHVHCLSIVTLFWGLKRSARYRNALECGFANRTVLGIGK